MENFLSDSETVHNDIRSVESSIQAHLENFRALVGTTFVKTSYVCDNVRDHILNYQDEPHLSKTQNICRRIFIASDLFFNLCSIYAQVVDYEYAKIISDMLQWEKYKQLSKKINSKMQLELKRENYFIREAQKMLQKCVGDTPIEEKDEVPPTDREERESETEIVARYGRGSFPTSLKQFEVAEKGTPSHELNGTLAPPLDSLTVDVLSNLTGDMSVIRGVTSNTFHLEPPVLNTLEPDLSLPKTEADISVGEPTFQLGSIGDIDIIRQILEDQNFEKENGEIVEPENLVRPGDKSQEILAEALAANSPLGDGGAAIDSEDSKEWSLPSLEDIEKTRRGRRYLIIDKAVTIPDYAAKAMLLNRNINIERVQVFEGPPKILQAISAGHLMTTPGRKSSHFKDVRSSKLVTLYNRHLEVEERPVEQPFMQRRIKEQSAVDTSKARITAETTEDVGTRTGMLSIHDKGDVLVEIPETRRPEIDTTSAAAPPQESLIGISMSRIINSKIEPPGKDEMERINTAPILSSSGVRQLQGKSLEPRTNPPWFYSANQSPPSSIYRKFNHVYEKLEKYWTLLEYQGTEKCITLSEFFHFEAGGNLADFLTVLRIVDKMSIKRKLVLEYKDGDVLIRPFESPYVSDAQLLLKEKEPIL